MASLKLFSIIFICLLPSAFSFWTPCPNRRAPRSVTSPSCNQRCRVVRGERIVMTVEADFLATHQNLRPRATAIFSGIQMVIPTVPGHDNICPLVNLNGAFHGCPVSPNTVYTWTIDMTVPRTIPTFDGRMRVEVLDGSNVVNCFEAHGTMV